MEEEGEEQKAQPMEEEGEEQKAQPSEEERKGLNTLFYYFGPILWWPGIELTMF